MTHEYAARMNTLACRLVPAALLRSPARRNELLNTVDRMFAQVGKHLKQEKNRCAG